MTKIHQEFRAAWAALVFFTRVRLPEIPGLGPEDLRRASTYFPLAGWFAGGFAAGVWWLASLYFPPALAGGLSLAATALLTGAMHEDGLADVCDGFGGGYSREKILTIMQDSRVGAFGVIGLVLVLGLKWQQIAALPAGITASALVAGHALSRSGSIALMATLDYAREGPSKAGPLVSRLRSFRLTTAIAIGLASLPLLPIRFWWAALAVPAVHLGARHWFCTRISGYTGDCLGATQQVGELAFLLTLGALT